MSGSNYHISGEKLVDEILRTIESPIVILDDDGAILRFNRAAQMLTGYSAREAIGLRIWDFLIFDEEIDAMRTMFQQRQEENAPTQLVNHWKTKDNRQRIIRWSNRKVPAENGRMLYILATGLDITDVRQSEKALIESKAFLRAIIDASPVSVITAKQDGSIVTFSKQAEKTFGYAESDTFGKNISILMPEPDRTRHDGYIDAYIETREAKIIGKARPVTAQKKDGAHFPALLHVSEFLEGDHIFVGFIEDITEKETTERQMADLREQLHHAGRLAAMGEVATSIAHELNQPLTAAASMAGAVSLTLKKNNGDPNGAALDMLDDVVSEIRRASEIIRQMRDFVRKGKTAKSLQNINAVINDACAIALIGADANSVRVERVFAADAGAGLFDPIQIQQVITNLIRNAIEAMQGQADQRLKISSSRNAEHITISVEDNGPGIPEDMLAHLFEPFVSDKDDGVGVGLSISKSIIDAHQGNISAKNKESGGSVFSFSLPAETHANG
ncbi:MAG: PAS domain S-box protein [Pseudomonadota bacterium]